MPCQNSGAVVLEGRPELPFEIKAGRFVQLWRHPTMVILPPMVHKAELRCDPADSSFDDHEPQLRITLRDSRGKQECETALHHKHLVIADRGVQRDIALDR